ncbi:MAG: alpha/beta hydrolase [Acidobacteria bacterium]|nr:alpha/beta hydrolase [Acidobacteriota bacterium]
MVLGAMLLLAASTAAAEPSIHVNPDLVYGHKMGMALTMDLFEPTVKANGAGILFMVSGGWRSNWTPPETGMALFRPLLEKGFKVFAVRHGSSPKFNIPEIVEDVRMAVRYVRTNATRYGIDPERLGVYGGSAGGHLSLMLGTTSSKEDRVAAVVAYFPPTDLRGWVSEDPNSNKSFPALRFSPTKAGDYSPLLHVTPDDPPTLLIHGDKDTLVPLSHSENILGAFKKSNVPAELIVIPGGGHGFKGDDAVRATTALVAWFERHLGAK